MRRGRPRHDLMRLRYLLGIAASLLAYLAVSFGFPVAAVPAPRSSAPRAVTVRACGCPVAGPDVPCCCTKKKTGRRSCCATTSEPESTTPTTATVVWVSGVQALECHGQNSLWVSVGAVVLPPCVDPDLPELVVWRVPSTEVSLTPIPAIPTEPPPRSSVL
jgi:hypothetical protein